MRAIMPQASGRKGHMGAGLLEGRLRTRVPWVGEFARFCLVGLVNAAANYSTYWLALEVASLHFLVAGWLGFLAGGVTGFLLNRKWTFRSSVPMASGISRYMAIQVFTLVAHSLTQWGVHVLFGVPEQYTQFFGIAVTTVLNFGLSRRLVFRRVA